MSARDGNDHDSMLDEHFTPSAGLALDDYILRGETNAVWHLIRYVWAAECLADRSGARRILDLGCGAGYGTYLLAQRFPERTVLGADYDLSAVESALATYALPNLEFTVGDARQWEATIGTATFDCVLAFDVIEHVEHREIGLRALVEHLDGAGCLLLSTPCSWSSPILKPFWEFHKIEYSAEELYDFLRRYFAIVNRPEDGSLPRVDVFDRLRGTGMEYLLHCNPVFCEQPVRFENPYRTAPRPTTDDAGLRVVAGDWTGCGADAPGVVDVKTGSAVLLTHAGPPITFDAGACGSEWTVVAGDWDGDGVDTLGMVRATTGDVVLLGSNADGAPRRAFRVEPSVVGGVAVAGDWDGDGIDSIGLFDPLTRIWRLKDANADGPFDRTFAFGPDSRGLVPFAGSWLGAEADAVGVYAPHSAAFYLRIDTKAGRPDFFFNYGTPDRIPIAGDWNGDGVDTLGVFEADNRMFFLRNEHAPGDADVKMRLPPGATE